MEAIFYPIIKIFREETGASLVTYEIDETSRHVEIQCHQQTVKTISQEMLQKMAISLFKAIKDGENRAFPIEDAPQMLSELCCTKLSATSGHKADIRMQLHDIHTGYQPLCGFSIKSELGHPPTLLNASGATNFVFEVKGIDDQQMAQINAIESKTKIIDRIRSIQEAGSLCFCQIDHEIFA